METKTQICPYLTAGYHAQPGALLVHKIPCLGSLCTMWRDKGAVFEGEAGKGNVTGKGRCFKNALGRWFDDPAGD